MATATQKFSNVLLRPEPRCVDKAVWRHLTRRQAHRIRPVWVQEPGVKVRTLPLSSARRNQSNEQRLQPNLAGNLGTHLCLPSNGEQISCTFNLVRIFRNRTVLLAHVNLIGNWDESAGKKIPLAGYPGGVFGF
jgi:hypothetical protein